MHKVDIENSKELNPIFPQLGCKESKGLSPIKISGVTFDSRQVKPGWAFVCISGQHVDGNQFVKDAVQSGAACIVSEVTHADCGVPCLTVPDAQLALAQIADYFYGHPSQSLRVLGVTGTNGKTTTTHIIQHILNFAGKKAGLIGTLGMKLPGDDRYYDAKFTTPQSSDLHKDLAQMVASGCSHVTMEVSSHALVQKRVAECHFASACLTNITQDHLDFHQTMLNYWQSKRLLFEGLNQSVHKNKSVVVNLDEPLAQEFLKVCGSEITKLTYAWGKGADVFVESVDFGFSGTKLVLQTPNGKLSMNLKLTGRFNIYNVMAAVLICLQEGISLDTISGALEQFSGVAGRFEIVSHNPGSEPLCIVDYAHTPDGLQNILKSARLLVPESGKLIVVFGCGGDRDSSKRPQMGEIAESLADLVIVTSDNPRSEAPQQIIANILAGIKRIQNIKVESDRASAIKLAISCAGPKDVVVVAGKGHEDYQILVDRTIPFDDRIQVRQALSANRQ